MKDNYEEIREKLIKINDKIRDNFKYKFTKEDLENIYDIMNVEDPVSYGFEDDETYIALYIDGMTKGYELAKANKKENKK